ncbi:lantibiotic dehydratase [Phytoactinopolyspora mesophila]|nr:lantibiotic dehydratase [Phytoactinopolyspora mesophila]
MTELLDRAASSRASGTSVWRFGQGYLVRVAGQPAGSVAALRTENAVEWAERVFELEAARDTTAADLCARLEELIATTGAADPGRVGLINLRRDVFNARRPRAGTVAKADPLLPPDTKVLFDEWTATVATLRETLDAGGEILGADITAARERARAAVAGDDLRSAVLLQSEVLEKNMDRYVDAKRAGKKAKLDKHGRQVERTLLELLYRAALKTSPFSTLTSVGMGRFSSQTDRVRPEPASLRQHPTVRLNVAVLARLAAVILADPELRSSLHVTLAPGASAEGDAMRYVRRRTSAGADPDAVVAIDSVHEDLFFLPSGPALDDVVGFTRERRPRLSELAGQITAASATRTPQEVDQLLGHLLRLGFLLAPDLQIDLRAADPAVPFVESLRAQPHPVLRDVGAQLAEVQALVERYPRITARQRRDVLTSIRDLVTECFAGVGATPALVPRTVIYEDTVIAGDGLDVSRDTWDASILPDLADVARILPAFDLNLPRRLTATGFFRARYGAGGRCDDVVRFCHEFQRDFFSPYTQRAMRRRQFDDDNAFVPQENWFKLPDIAAVDEAREAASLHLRDLQASSGATDEIRLGPEFVDAVTRHLPPDERVAQPWSFFVQLATGESGPEPGRLVLNQAYAGMTLMFSRFAHSLDAAGVGASELIREVLDDYAPDGAVLAELRGGYETTNLNVHPGVTRYEIVCPGDASTRPPDELISLEDLALVHDAETDRLTLVSDRLGCEVIPIYLGFLMPMALPEVQQVLMCLSPTGMAQIDLWAGTGEPVPAEGITMYPRLLLGELVLQRRMWKLSTDAFPFRDPQRSEAEHFLELHRWRRRHGLPERLFAQVDAAAARTTADDGDAADTGDDPAGAGGPERKSGRKPLPVDFRSWASLQLFEQMALGASSRIVLTEPYPDLDGLWLHDEHGRPHVSELLVELYHTGRDDHA